MPSTRTAPANGKRPSAKPAAGRRAVAAKAGGSAPLRRAALVVDAVAASPQGMTLQQIAEAIGLSASTVHRLLQSLVAIDYLTLDRERRAYRVGRRLVRLGPMSISAASIEAIAEAVLSRLANRFQQSAYLTRLLGEEVKLAACAMPDEFGGTLVHPGGLFPPHASAAAKAIFAHQDEELVKQVLARELVQYQVSTRTRPREIRAEFAQIRRSGYAVIDGELDPGVFAVACPVFLPVAGAAFAIGIVGLKDRMLEGHAVGDYADELKAGARELGLLLVNVAQAGGAPSARHRNGS